ncbi:hypothetical protein BK120_32795 [Paenibacillus sp. FSL A5-0031]|uniref:hypothetical protein n=1 Tax=Paenibacillus sp. FSL A5-0031 TaxID=1920420 RepID=UPI00096FA668|nr:hypothetical protein [Paenibacillus sp. FSL A5-0031]OME73013.1 hypothetical protein BK120_32795 [Paenibacillus sp. FSL A5-0031]
MEKACLLDASNSFFTLCFGLFQTFIGIIYFGWSTLVGDLELVITVLLRYGKRSQTVASQLE